MKLNFHKFCINHVIVAAVNFATIFRFVFESRFECETKKCMFVESIKNAIKSYALRDNLIVLVKRICAKWHCTGSDRIVQQLTVQHPMNFERCRIGLHLATKHGSFANDHLTAQRSIQRDQSSWTICKRRDACRTKNELICIEINLFAIDERFVVTEMNLQWTWSGHASWIELLANSGLMARQIKVHWSWLANGFSCRTDRLRPSVVTFVWLLDGNGWAKQEQISRATQWKWER